MRSFPVVTIYRRRRGRDRRQLRRSHGRCVHQQVVSHYSNGQVHNHEDGYCRGGLALVEDVKVREPKEQGDQDGKAKKEPPGSRATGSPPATPRRRLSPLLPSAWRSQRTGSAHSLWYWGKQPPRHHNIASQAREPMMAAAVTNATRRAEGGRCAGEKSSRAMDISCSSTFDCPSRQAAWSRSPGSPTPEFRPSAVIMLRMLRAAFGSQVLCRRGPIMLRWRGTDWPPLGGSHNERDPETNPGTSPAGTELPIEHSRHADGTCLSVGGRGTGLTIACPASACERDPWNCERWEGDANSGAVPAGHRSPRGSRPPRSGDLAAFTAPDLVAIRRTGADKCRRAAFFRTTPPNGNQNDFFPAAARALGPVGRCRPCCCTYTDDSAGRLRASNR